jgi:hypothetical protein
MLVAGKHTGSERPRSSTPGIRGRANGRVMREFQATAGTEESISAKDQTAVNCHYMTQYVA